MGIKEVQENLQMTGFGHFVSFKNKNKNKNWATSVLLTLMICNHLATDDHTVIFGQEILWKPVLRKSGYTSVAISHAIKLLVWLGGV